MENFYSESKSRSKNQKNKSAPLVTTYVKFTYVFACEFFPEIKFMGRKFKVTIFSG